MLGQRILDVFQFEVTNDGFDFLHGHTPMLLRPSAVAACLRLFYRIFLLEDVSFFPVFTEV